LDYSGSLEEIKVSLVSIDSRVPGSLTRVTLSSSEFSNLLDYLSKAYPSAYTDYFYAVLGDKFLQYLDVFEGATIKVPSRRVLVKEINQVKIYSYLADRSFTEEAYSKASLLFKKRSSVLHKIVDRISAKLAEEEN
jgi:hypothetical protein